MVRLGGQPDKLHVLLSEITFRFFGFGDNGMAKPSGNESPSSLAILPSNSELHRVTDESETKGKS